MAIRAELWSELAPPASARALLGQLAPCADRIAIAGTGITIGGFIGHFVGLLARAAGDPDDAVESLTTALARREAAGFRPFAVAVAHELAATLRLRGLPGDEPKPRPWTFERPRWRRPARAAAIPVIPINTLPRTGPGRPMRSGL